VWDEGLVFADAARASPEIGKRLPAKVLDELFDPVHVLRHAEAIVARALKEE
jgi:hypothetical protein